MTGRFGIVTAEFGQVTDRFGNVTDRFGDVTDGVSRDLRQQALDTVERWLNTGDSRSMGLWREWQEILRQGTWRKVLGRTRRAQALRQASPLVTLLPESVRQGILAQVRMLKNGVVLGDAGSPAMP